MFRLLKANEIDCRVATVSATGCSLLLYKDARVDQNILDETVTPQRWQRHHEVIDGNLYCSVGIKFGDEWVWKQDVGTESYTEKEKGQASDSFKRACFNWGIGRELYSAPFIWIASGKVKIEERGGKYTTKERFYVSRIGYDADRNINQLTITNKSGVVMYVFGEAESEEEHMVEKGSDKLNPTDLQAMRNAIKRINKTEESVCEYFKIKKLEDMTVTQMTSFIKIIEETAKKKEKKDE